MGLVPAFWAYGRRLSLGLPLAFPLFRVPWMGSVGACGYDLVIFRISGPGSLRLGLRDLSPCSVGSSIGSRSFKGSGLAGRRRLKALVQGFYNHRTFGDLGAVELRTFEL